MRSSVVATALCAVSVCVLLTLGGALTLADPPESEPEISLVANGDFERADAKDAMRPAGWSLPDGLGVQWTNAPPEAEPTTHGKALRLDTRVSERDLVAQWKRMGITAWDIPKPEASAVAGTYGLSYYSDAFPVVSGQVYRVEFDYYGPSGGAKVWVRGYGQWAGEKRRRFETIVNCKGRGGVWTHQAREFCPTALTPEVTEMKVMLYAYWPPGVYWFDHVRITPVLPIP